LIFKAILHATNSFVYAFLQKSKGTVPFDFLIVAQIKSHPEGKAFQ